MKNKLNTLLAILSISVMNFAFAENTTYVPVFWVKEGKIPNTLNVKFKNKNDCEVVSKQFITPTKDDKSIYLHDCTEVFTKNQENSYWFMTMWSEKESKPIVLPFALENKKSCDKIGLDMNNITKSTIKLERNYLCQSVSNVY